MGSVKDFSIGVIGLGTVGTATIKLLEDQLVSINKKSGKKTLKKLTEKGFNASFYKNTKNSFSLKVGQFNNLKDARKAQSRLKLKGFLSGMQKKDVALKTYIVQLGVFPNLEKARLSQEKLARAGFSKTFIR